MLFVFGPNQSYFARLPDINKWSPNFAKSILHIFERPAYIHFVAFPATEQTADQDFQKALIPQTLEAYVGYCTHLFSSGHVYSPPSPFCLPGLAEWSKARSWWIDGIQVVCNGKGGWWAQAGGKREWHNLTTEQEQFLKAGNPHGKVASVAFGVGDAYVVRFNDGHVVWDLKGAYDALDKRLEAELTSPGKLRYIALNPYHADQFFCVFSDASAIYAFPDEEDYKKLDEEILHGRGLRVIPDSITFKQSPGMPQEEIKEETSTTFGKSLEGAGKHVVTTQLSNILDNM